MSLRKPSTVKGEWNVRIKTDQQGKTIINVNLTNITAQEYVKTSQYGGQMVVFTGKSTGKFEQIIADQIK